MKTTLLIAIGMFRVFIAFCFSDSTYAQSSDLPDPPKWLSSRDQNAYEQQKTVLINYRDSLNKRIADFDAKCASFEKGSPLEAECQAEAAQINSDKNVYNAMKEAYVNSLNITVRKHDVDVINIQVAAVRTQINIVKKALQGLNKSMSLDPDERKAREEESRKALNDTYWLVGDLTFFCLNYHYDKNIQDAEKEIQDAITKLSGTTDPDRRVQLHSAFASLKDRLDELKRSQGVVEINEKTFDVAHQIVKLHDDENSDILETTFDLISQAPGFPRQATVLKMTTMAWYDATVQVLNLEQIDALNAHTDQYMQAVDALNTRMKRLVKVENILNEQKNLLY